MRLFPILFAAGMLSQAAAAETTAPASIPAPSAPGAMGSSLAPGPDGAAYLSWLEPADNANWALKFSRYDAARQRWGDARLIAQGADFFVNWADFPVLAVQADRLTAVWFVNNPGGGPGRQGATYRALHSVSTDGGEHWSAPQPVTGASGSVEFVALQPLRDGRLLAAWLDGRAHAAGSGRQQLYARMLGAPGPDVLVDGSVCDCCQLSFVPTTDGGALLAYRGRTNDEVRDMRVARFDGKNWRAPTALHADGWRIAGCPVNGPQLAECGDRIGAVWFTAADNQARVLARVSDNAGDSFGPLVRVDLGRPQGRVDSVMLADGTLVMSWLEMTGKDTGRQGGIYLRTLSLAGRLSEPQLVAPSSTSRMSGFPRMVLRGGRQLLLTGTVDGEPSQLRTLLVELN
ncbi:MAG: exo-alpha-sialidase [Opitutae bacterium]|nr:exo-alpha-sialidase [Opitutae bacterium]